MAAPFHITTPIPTMEETAKVTGVSPSRLKKLIKMADDILDQRAAKRKDTASRSGKDIAPRSVASERAARGRFAR